MSKPAWLTARSNAKLGHWTVYPTNIGAMLFQLEDSDFTVILRVTSMWDSELECRTACCGAGASRLGEDRRICGKCHRDLPLCVTDIDLVGKWHGGVADWLDTQGVNGQFLSPLETVLLASELQDTVQALSDLRRAVHEREVARFGEAELKKKGHMAPTGHFSVMQEEVYRLPWTAEVLEGLLA